jgi:L-2,4-diaminobutyrate decarboxylase
MFRYKPAGLRNPGLLDALNAAIRKSVRRDGRAMIASAREAGRLYLKLTLLNPAATAEDVRAVLEVIRRHGEDCRHALHPAVTHRRRAN